MLYCDLDKLVTVGAYEPVALRLPAGLDPNDPDVAVNLNLDTENFAAGIAHVTLSPCSTKNVVIGGWRGRFAKLKPPCVGYPAW